MAVKACAAITVSIERDIQGTWRFYRIASSTATPSAPTEQEGKAFVSSGTVPSGWSKVEPAYDETSTNSLYSVDLTAFTDGSVVWSGVSKSSSYEASKQAYNVAETAQTLANNTAQNLSENYTGTDAMNSAIAEAVDAEANARAIADLAKIDRVNGDSEHYWENGIYKVVARKGSETYSTEIGGDGIEFKHNDLTVASIDQDRLVIDKTVVLDEMQVGNSKWTWKIDPDDNTIFLKWIG